MKIKVNWKELGKQLWAAIRPILLGAVGGGLVAFNSGCSTQATTPRGQTTEIVAIGIPAVAWISHTTQDADHRAGDTNSVGQTNANAVTPSVDIGGMTF